MRGHAFLAGAEKAEREQPLVQGNMRALVDRASADRELVLTILAVIPARSHGLAAKRPSAFHRAAKRAGHAVRPADGLKVLTGGFVVRVDRVGKFYRRHG